MTLQDHDYVVLVAEPRKEAPSHVLWRKRPENRKKIKAYAKKWYAANKEKVKLKWMMKKD